METFGFRGEALSSLCALSDLTIATRHSTCEHGYKLRFDRNGVLEKTEHCAREPGTTVTVKNIFKSLPVRAKEFAKNIQKEFAKTIQVLYSYCLVATGVKITCSNSVTGRSTSIVVSTTGTESVLENIRSTFGKKCLAGLREIEIQPPDSETLQEYNLPPKTEVDFTWEFYTSSCEHSMGRSAPDRQFFYVNGRPCHLAKVSKLINNVYHKYNNKQYPFVYLNLKPNQQCADVNVTPDKRTIFLTQEKLILAVVKANLVRTWEKMQGNFNTKSLEELGCTLKRKIPRGMSMSPETPTKKCIKAAGSIDDDRSLTINDRGRENNSDVMLVEKLKDRQLRISMESVKLHIEKRKRAESCCERKAKGVKYRARIEPGKSSEAEKELQKELTKESFSKVWVINFLLHVAKMY